MATLDFKIRRNSKTFTVSINVNEEIQDIQLEIELAEYLSSILEQEEEEIIKLLAFIEFVRLDSSPTKKKKLKKIIDDMEFRENLKVLLEVKSIDEIIDDIEELKYNKICEYFLSESFEE